jgi:hypothetical protein
MKNLRPCNSAILTFGIELFCVRLIPALVFADTEVRSKKA